MIVKAKHFLCEQCGEESLFNSPKAARAAGWAISHDRKKCYCPSCAPFYRNVGRTGKPRKKVQWSLF